MKQKITDYLDEIYGGTFTATHLQKLVTRLESAKRLITQRRKKHWDESDVVLITYADQFHSNDLKPLPTFNQFYHQWLQSIFSHVHLLPFYPWSSDDGFSVIDYHQVASEAGEWQDIQQLGECSHLMFDFVCNHMSAKSEWFKNYLQQHPGFEDFFIAVDPQTDLSAVTRPRALPLLTPFQMRDHSTRHLWTTFSDDQIDLNYRSPEVLLAMVDVLLCYLAKGAEYVRLDAVGFMWKEPGTSCIHLEKTHLIIKLLRKEENKTNVSIEFMHSSVEQERQAVISKLIARFEKENPGITVKQVPVEEDAYNTKVITLSRSGSLPEVIETSHDYAKVMDKEQLIDRKAVATVISNVGEGAFYDGVLRIVRTEDGSAWTGVPVSAWIGGIWYRKDVLAKAGLEEPKNWQQLLDVAQKLNDPANKKYGIALPTAESVLTEQSFSQFALSNQANVFNAEGKITLDTPEMMQALTYYRDLTANTMPGSNDIMEVKDAFMNGTAPMAIYSTYILPAVIKEGDPKNVGFVVPTEKNSAVYGMLTSLTITAGQKTEETEAAEKFVTFMEQADNIADWVMMSPGAALPVNKAVVTTATWKDNDVIKALGELPNQLIGELPNIQVFGAVGDKNFTRMGDVTGSGVVSSMVHNVTVGKADLSTTLQASQKKLDELIEQH